MPPASPAISRASRPLRRGTRTPGASLPAAPHVMDLHQCIIGIALSDLESAGSLMGLAPSHIDPAGRVIGIERGNSDPAGRVIGRTVGHVDPAGCLTDLSLFDMDRAGRDTGLQLPISMLRRATWVMPRRPTMIRCHSSGFHRPMQILCSPASLPPGAENETRRRVSCRPAAILPIAVHMPIDPPTKFPEHLAPI